MGLVQFDEQAARRAVRIADLLDTYRARLDRLEHHLKIHEGHLHGLTATCANLIGKLDELNTRVGALEALLHEPGTFQGAATIDGGRRT